MQKIADLVKLSELKRMLVKQLRDLGLKEEMSVVNDGDLESLVRFMAHLNKSLDKFETEDEKTNFLILYILSLASSLIVVFGQTDQDLIK